MSKNEMILPPGWEIYNRYTYAPAVLRGNHLYIAGATSFDPKTKQLIGEGDIVAQTDFILQKFGEILKQVNATYDDIVMTKEYITTTENYKATADVRRKYFRNGFPAATGVIVNGLLRPGALIEIEAVAVID